MLIGLCGTIGSGKDTFANALQLHHQFIKLSWADALKDVVATVFGWDRALLEGDTPQSREFRETVDEWWSQRLQIPNLTPRKMLQTIGTDVMRHHFHNEIWVATIERKLKKLLEQHHDVIIADCRFAHELETIKRLGGTTIKVRRGKHDSYLLQLARSAACHDNAIAKARLQEMNIHSTEWYALGCTCDHELINEASSAQQFIEEALHLFSKVAIAASPTPNASSY